MLPMMLPRRQSADAGGGSTPKVLGFVLLSIMIVSFTCLGTGCIFVIYLRRRNRPAAPRPEETMPAERASEIKSSPRKLTKPHILKRQSSLRRISLSSIFEAQRRSSEGNASRDLERQDSPTTPRSFLVVSVVEEEEEAIPGLAEGAVQQHGGGDVYRPVSDSMSTWQTPRSSFGLDGITGGQQPSQEAMVPIPPIPELPGSEPVMAPVAIPRRSRHRRTPAQDSIPFLNGPAARCMPMPPALHLRTPVGSIDSLLAVATQELALPGGAASPSRARAHTHWQQQQQQQQSTSLALWGPPPKHPERPVPELPRLQIPGTYTAPPRILPPTPLPPRGPYARPGADTGRSMPIPQGPRQGPVASQLSQALKAQLLIAAAQRRANPGNDSSSLSTLWSVEEPEERTPERRSTTGEEALTSTLTENGPGYDQERISFAPSSPISVCSSEFSVPPAVSPGSLTPIAAIWQTAMGDVNDSTALSDFGSTVADPGVGFEPKMNHDASLKHASRGSVVSPWPSPAKIARISRPSIMPRGVEILPPPRPYSELHSLFTTAPKVMAPPFRSRSSSPSTTRTTSSATVSAARLLSSSSSHYSSAYSTDSLSAGSSSCSKKLTAPRDPGAPSVGDVAAQLRRMNDSSYSLASLASTAMPGAGLGTLEVKKTRSRPASERVALSESVSLYDMDGFLVEERLEEERDRD